MSYRELQNFCEMMRSLGYPRTISMENFRVSNFKLVAEIIFWLATRLDKKADIPDNIEDEKARVEFIRSACTFFYNNLKLKLNLKKLYAADGHAVQELLKVVQILYNAKKSVTFQNDYEIGQELDITSKKNDLNTIKELSQEIVDLGLNVRKNIFFNFLFFIFKKCSYWIY
jgi:clusterin-associated protein 1